MISRLSKTSGHSFRKYLGQFPGGLAKIVSVNQCFGQAASTGPPDSCRHCEGQTWIDNPHGYAGSPSVDRQSVKLTWH